MGAALQLQVLPVSGSASVVDNTSQVRILLTITTNNGTYNEEGSTAGYLTLDGTQIASLAARKVYLNTTTTLYDRVHTVAHHDDGSRSVTVQAAFDVNTATRWIYAEETAVLETIPRAATLTVPVFTLGRPGTLRIDRAADFTCSVDYVLGDESGTLLEKSKETQLVWTPPLSLARAFPDAPAGEATLTVTTWRGETVIGQRSYGAVLRAGEELAPQIGAVTVECVSDNAAIHSWGVAVKGKSRLAFSVQATAQEGAAIESGTFGCGGAVGHGLQGETGLLQRAGLFVPRISVTDSRGKTAQTQLQTVKVYDYAPPAFRQSAVFRADSSGVADGAGSCAAVSAAADCADIGGHNDLQLRCRYRAVGGAWSGYTALADGEVTVLHGFDISTSYEVEVEAADTVGEKRTVVYTVPTAQVAFHLRQGGSGAAFGKYAERDGWLESEWGVDLRGNRLTGLAAPEEDGDAVSRAALAQALSSAAQETAQTMTELESRLQTLIALLAPPELVPGVEYPTAEQWNGAPVYVMAVDYGALPNDDEAENYDLPAGLNVISMEGFAVGPAYNIPIPGYYAVESMGYNRGTGNLWLSTTADLSAYHGYIRVKYTK